MRYLAPVLALVSLACSGGGYTQVQLDQAFLLLRDKAEQVCQVNQAPPGCYALSGTLASAVLAVEQARTSGSAADIQTAADRVLHAEQELAALAGK